MMDFNKNWKFYLGDVTSGHLLDLDEQEFKAVNLPHDYSIEQPYNQEVGDGCTGYLLGGIGWYRKSFQTTPEMKEGKVFVCFDGIYNRSNIYINEHFIAFHPYGYSPLLLDITEYLNDEDNVLAVQVDHTRYADSRWYTGSGIYRKVALHVLPKTYVPVWGMKVKTTDVSEEKATVQIALDICSEKNEGEAVALTRIYAPDGTIVGSRKSDVSLQKEQEVHQMVEIMNPVLWGIYNGNLYTAKTSLMVNDVCIQKKEVKFGIRYFHFDTNEGFFLNGRNELIKGVCLHHDGGLVGSAVPKDVWKRRFQKLVDGGCNAIRTAHNPASAEFLELCDEMGILVQEEFYDEWDNPKDKRYNMKEQKVDYITRGHHEFFKDYAEQDLKAVVNRDFNHPSIIQWSIGNEIEWTYPKYVMATGYFSASANGNYFWEEPPYSVEQIRENVSKLPRELYEVGDTAKKLATWTKELDTSRPVIANCILPSASYESGYVDALDMVGFSYRQVVYERSHKNYPEKPIMGAENLGQWHEWKHVLEKPYISGIFLWTGVDYIGESGNVDIWPRKATAAGLLDVAGFPKGSYHMFKSLWTEEPCIHMVSQTLEKSLYNLTASGELVDKEGKSWQSRLWTWQDVNEHWNYEEKEAVVVEVYSNCDSVTLYLNDEVVSTKQLVDFPDRIYKWYMPYVEGTVVAVGNKDEEEVTTALITASEATTVRLTVDKECIRCSDDSVVHVEAELYDKYGNVVRCNDVEITFDIEGMARIYGVDNGSPDFVGDHFSHKIMTHNGRALLIIGGEAIGTVCVSAYINEENVETVMVKVVGAMN